MFISLASIHTSMWIVYVMWHASIEFYDAKYSPWKFSSLNLRFRAISLVPVCLSAYSQHEFGHGVLCVCVRSTFARCGWPISLHLTLRHFRFSSIKNKTYIFCGLVELMPSVRLALTFNLRRKFSHHVHTFDEKTKNWKDSRSILMRQKLNGKLEGGWEGGGFCWTRNKTKNLKRSKSKRIHSHTPLSSLFYCFYFYGWKSQLQLRRRVHRRRETSCARKWRRSLEWMDRCMHLSPFFLVTCIYAFVAEYTELSHETKKKRVQQTRTHNITHAMRCAIWFVTFSLMCPVSTLLVRIEIPFSFGSFNRSIVASIVWFPCTLRQTHTHTQQSA